MEKDIVKHNEDIFLVAGATGRCGRYIIKALLAKNKRVRVLVRNQKKLEETFTSDELKRLDRVIICNLVNSKDWAEKLAESFKTKDGEVVSYVISALSYRFENDQTSEQGNLLTNQRLIDAAVLSGNVKKFCLLSSTHVRRPYSYISLTCNINKKYMQWYKVLVEDYLRKSKLTYLIIRPTGLLVNEESTSFTISQGDKVSGQINVGTVGKLTVDTLLDSWIPSNTSYECFSTIEQIKTPYEYFQGRYGLRAETENEKKLVNHKTATRVVMTALWTMLFTAGYFGFKYGKNHINWERVMNILKRLVGRGNTK
jgi:hypothetical protein